MSRDIKVALTGCLEKKLFTNPFVDGKKPEKYLLRAQIARISHSTNLVPAGVLRLQEES